MTDKQALLALADRCEQATGADQKALILQAWEICNPEPFRGHISELEEHREWRESYNRIYDLLKASGFLDAAMTLVPDECWAEGAFGVNRGRSSIEVHSPMTYDALGSAVAETPALALTAACLRAIAGAME